MTEFKARNESDLQRLVDLLDKEMGANTIGELELYIRYTPLTTELGDLLWQVLSHAHSKIDKLILGFHTASAFGESEVMKSIKRWCEEVPAKRSRSLQLSFPTMEPTERNLQALHDLREALTCPNNNVSTLRVHEALMDIRICDSFLRPILEHPNNQITVLGLFGIHALRTSSAIGGWASRSSDEEMTALSKGVASPNAKLRFFFLCDSILCYTGLKTLLDSLGKAFDLNALRLTGFDLALTDEEKGDIMDRMARIMERPGNRICWLDIKLGGTWNRNHASVLARGLTSEHSRVNRFEFQDRPLDEYTFLPLIAALRHPNNRVTSFSINFCGPNAAIAFGEALIDPNCRIEKLMLWKLESPTPLATFKALKLSDASKLTDLTLRALPREMYDVLADCLQSRKNRLNALTLWSVPYLDDAIHCRLCCAIRRSCVSEISFHTSDHDQPIPRFYRVMNQPFFQVLHTLISIKYVPRLGRYAWLTLLPVQDFILMIAETLGWPLDELRLRLPRKYDQGE